MFIPYGRQEITQADIDAVTDVLRSDFLTQGPQVPAFEASVVEATGAAHAVAVNSATSALHIACLALGVGPGDMVWTSPISFVASSNCALYTGADVDFVDIYPRTFNMSAKGLRAKLEATQAAGGRMPKVVIPVHMAGQSAEMDVIWDLAQQYGFRVIEDASHAIGARYKNEPVGNCRYSDVCVFSFHPVKIVTTAEGGMCTTNDAELAREMELLRSHGVTRDPELMTHEADGPWYYQQVRLGLNYRMTEMQAALGVSQMTRVHDFVARRQELAARYDERLADLPLVRPWQHPDVYSSYHLYVIQPDLERTELSHREIFEALRADGIGVNLHYIPIHTQPYYRDLGFSPGQFPAAESYYERAISIPLFHSMTDEQQDRVVEVLERVLSARK